MIDGKVLPSWFAVAVAGACIGFGFFQVFFGYKFFRVTLFVLGFTVVGVAIFLLSWDHINDPNAMWIGLAMGVMAGLMVGGVGAYVPRVGVFLVGAALGVVLALDLNTTVLWRLYPSNPNLTLGVAGGLLGAGFGGLSMLMMRTVVICSTSVVGAYALIRGVGYFAGNYPADELALKDQIANGQTLPVAVYGYFSGMLALALLGIAIQFLYTAKKANKDEKDEWEEAYDDSEMSLDALRGASGARGGGRGEGRGWAASRIIDAMSECAPNSSPLSSSRRQEQEEEEVPEGPQVQARPPQVQEAGSQGRRAAGRL